MVNKKGHLVTVLQSREAQVLLYYCCSGNPLKQTLLRPLLCVYNMEVSVCRVLNVHKHNIVNAFRTKQSVWDIIGGRFSGVSVRWGSTVFSTVIG